MKDVQVKKSPKKDQKSPNPVTMGISNSSNSNPFEAFSKKGVRLEICIIVCVPSKQDDLYAS
jgi:hypothetical protein